MIMVLGIVSLFTCFILGIIAVVKAKPVLEEMDANPGMYTNRGSVAAGRICGIISIVLQVIGVLMYVIFGVILVAANS